MYTDTQSYPLRDCTPLALRHRSRLVSSAVLTGGGHTPVVLCCVLVYTPEPTVRRLRVPDGRRRARVAHAPKAPNDEARVFAEARQPYHTAGAAPAGALFGPQVARGRAGDGPKVFPRWDAAPVPLSGPLLAIFFVHIRSLPPPGSCYRGVLNQ